jgi:hypothetical protein
MISAALCAWQACHVLDGIAQRHKWLALTWYWNRFENSRSQDIQRPMLAGLA